MIYFAQRKAIRYEILETMALRNLPVNYIVGNLQTGIKRSGEFKYSEKQRNMIASIIPSTIILKQKGSE